MQTHVSVSRSPVSNFTCGFTANSVNLCTVEAASPLIPQCTCTLPKSTLPTDGERHLTNNTTADLVVSHKPTCCHNNPVWVLLFDTNPKFGFLKSHRLACQHSHYILDGRFIATNEDLQLQRHDWTTNFFPVSPIVRGQISSEFSALIFPT